MREDQNISVSLVIPGRNAARTIRPCLDSVVPLLGRDGLREIIFVDDGSTDETRELVAKYPVTLLRGKGRGPGAARNLGWRAATGTLIWFMDGDCVATEDTLPRLLRHLEDPRVVAAGGSLWNMTPDSLLACLTHEEIIERHIRMPSRVDFLSTANVLYRHAALEQTGGFDEAYLKAQDAELAWRLKAAGWELGFELESRVGHHYHLRWLPYLKSQAQQGYWRVSLHLTHQGHGGGDSYSSLLDHLQPPLAMAVLGLAPLNLIIPGQPYIFYLTATVAGALLLAQIPMTWRLVRRTRQLRYLAFAGMNILRSFWRGVGMSIGVLDHARRKRTSPGP